MTKGVSVPRSPFGVSSATTADVSCLAPGVYILEITTAKEKYYTKFVKR